MKKIATTPYIVTAILFIIILYGCKKQDAFLDKKPNTSLIVPTSLSDVELLLSNEAIFNVYSMPSMTLVSTDDLYVTDDAFLSGSTTPRNAYAFATDIYESSGEYADWTDCYKQVYYCNVALDALKKLTPSVEEQARYNSLKGDALFKRAFAFLMLVQEFTLPYDASTASTDLGVPMPTNSDLNIRYPRGTVQQAYDKIIADVMQARLLLPVRSTSVTKACRVGCDAFMARLYHSIRLYDQALASADLCLKDYGTLLDYNSITPQRWSLSNDILSEDIYHSTTLGFSLTIQIDTNLYKTYETNDTRKEHYFRMSGARRIFRGHYSRFQNYVGLATDETYLIRAECNVRSGNNKLALDDLNLLLRNRYKTGQFTPLLISGDALLDRILLERKKELFMRGLRWTDLRRLNKEQRFRTDVIHKVGGHAYILPANDPKYALPIPPTEIQLNNIPQNNR